MITEPFQRVVRKLDGTSIIDDNAVDSREGFRSANLRLFPGAPAIDVDVIVEAPRRDLALTGTRTILSTIGSIASDEDLERFPELGGYQVECALPEWTAGNKFKALHLRAVRGRHPPNLDGIAARGRDLGDLYEIAGTEHGERVRPLLDQMEGRKARPLSQRREASRPPGGFGASPLFRFGTDQCDALIDGYERAASRLIWGKPPPASEALRAAKSLDLR